MKFNRNNDDIFKQIMTNEKFLKLEDENIFLGLVENDVVSPSFSCKPDKIITTVSNPKFETLIDQGYIQDVSDIYSLKEKRQELLDKKIIGLQKSTDNLLNAIEKSKDNDAIKILTALGIPNIGKSAAKSLKETWRNEK